MPQAQNNIYVDQALTNVSIKYQNDQTSFVADSIFPRLPVVKKTGIYYEYDKSNMRAENDERAPGTEANEIEYDLIQRTYGPLVDHALKAKVTDEEVELSDAALAPFIDATETVTEKIWISKEVDAATKLANASVVTQGVTLSGTAQWSDFANSNPFADFQLARDSIKQTALRMPNTLVLSYPVYSMLLEHPDFRNRLSNSSDRVMNTAKLAELLGIKQVIVADAMKNSAIKGATDALGFIWAKNAYMMYAEPNPGLRKMSAAYTLELTNGIEVARWYEQSIHSSWIECRRFYEQKITNANAIYRFTNAVA